MTTNDGCRADVRKARAEAVEVDPTAAAVRAAQAEAWEEGFQDGRRQDAEGDDGPRFINPYRADRLATDTAAPEGAESRVRHALLSSLLDEYGADEETWMALGSLRRVTRAALAAAAPVAVEGVEAVEPEIADYVDVLAASAELLLTDIRCLAARLSPVEPETSEPEGGES